VPTKYPTPTPTEIIKMQSITAKIFFFIIQIIFNPKRLQLTFLLIYPFTLQHEYFAEEQNIRDINYPHFP